MIMMMNSTTLKEEAREKEENEEEEKTMAIWDCGSPLYDSYELVSLDHIIGRHLMAFPSSNGSSKHIITRFTHHSHHHRDRVTQKSKGSFIITGMNKISVKMLKKRKNNEEIKGNKRRGFAGFVVAFVVENNHFVMVEFYVPGVVTTRPLRPSMPLWLPSSSPTMLFWPRSTPPLRTNWHEYDVQGFPTVFFFVDGVHKPYTGQRTKDGIVTWIKKKIGPGVSNITTLDEVERILTAESKVVLGFLNSLVGAESDELTAASKLEDGVNFYQTMVPEVAKVFHIDAGVKRPALILLKKEEANL
ncbi:hypothetical protein V8G54_009834 [Vigna mungo]|uniref:protein disulfide-isomerase n=1 Tax=Vigna mungo TaxID=3915 RepID=A0AAQ3NXZ7_VIGMU